MANPKLRFKKPDESDYPDWEEKKITKLFKKIKAGGTPLATNSKYYNNGKIPFLSISDMTESDKYISKTKKQITEAGLKNSTAWLVPNESIVLSMYASFGKVGITRKNLATSQAILALCNPQGNNLEFLYQLLDYLNITGYWKASVQLGTQANLSAKIVKNTSMFVPCVEEQQQIADFFLKIDETIEATEKEIQNLTLAKKGEMQKIFSQKVRFKASDGNEYPDWKKKTLEDIAEYQTTGLSAKDVQNKGKYKLFDATGEIGHCNDGFSTEIITIIKDGSSVGRVNYLPAKSTCLGTMGVITSKRGINQKYLFYLLSSLSFRRYINGSGIPHIYFRDYKHLSVSVPCIEEQEQIATYLSHYDEAISAAKSELELWKELKRGYMQQMFV